MSKEEIIAKLSELGVAFNPQANKGSLEKLLADSSKGETKPTSNKEDTILEILQGLKSSFVSLEGRIATLEGAPTQAFKEKAESKDVEAASISKEKVDPKIAAIVEEILGTDFKIEIQGYEDRPGFLFTVIVPQRLSDTPKSQRPKIGENGEYLKDSFGNVVLEEYFPEDRRSRPLGSADSYTAIREHCEKVRGYIVNYYQKLNKPIPEFKYKTL